MEVGARPPQSSFSRSRRGVQGLGLTRTRSRHRCVVQRAVSGGEKGLVGGDKGGKEDALRAELRGAEERARAMVLMMEEEWRMKHGQGNPGVVKGIGQTLEATDEEAEEGEEGDGLGNLEVEYVIEEEDCTHTAEREVDESAAPGNTTGKRLPAEMKYFDTARICVKSGDGGRGEVAFRREKHVPHGGPSGGNGGRGGHVYMNASRKAGNSLYTFRTSVHFKAGKGVAGQGSSKDGAAGRDKEVFVPPGTIVKRSNGDIVAELVKEGDRLLLLRGGRGGKGNGAFKTRNNRAPQIAENGEAGTEEWLTLELKVVADVGIIGMPNAGKSTLLSSITNAKPKIANYPFTTLVPNLGVCEQDDTSTIFADVPGLLEGAHTGHGLGQEFLRHCERARVLVHVLDCSMPDPVADMDIINEELRLFNKKLAAKPQVVALNKIDLPEAQEKAARVESALRQRGLQVRSMSAATTEGVKNVVREARVLLESLPEGEYTEYVNYQLEGTDRALNDSSAELQDFSLTVDYDTRNFSVSGQALERFVKMTNFEFWESILRLQTVLKLGGITAALKKAGVSEGDTVSVGDVSFEWQDEEDKGKLYEDWLKSRSGAGRGSKRWPHGG